MEWRKHPIGAVCTATEQRDPGEHPGSQFRYIDIAGIDRTHKRIADCQRLFGKDAPSRARKVIRKDDVLVSTVRPNLNAVALVPEDLDGEIASTGFCVLRANRKLVEPRYLFYWTTSNDFVDALAARVRGANYPAVSDTDVKEIHIPLPPLSEQRRIVEILDEADSLRRFRAEANTTADRTLPAILARRLGSPVSWRLDSCCASLEKLVHLLSGATPSTKATHFWSGNVPWVSPKDMKQDFVSDSMDHVSEAALDETNLALVEQGSVLIVVRGMILARDVPVAINLRPVTINQDMKALIPKTNEVSGAYIWAALRLAKRQLQALVRTAGHGTRKLDTPDLMQFRIPSPNPNRVRDVTSVVEHHRVAIELRARSAAFIDRLFAITLRKAFDGSLTTAWREAHLQELLREMDQQAKALAVA